MTIQMKKTIIALLIACLSFTSSCAGKEIVEGEIAKQEVPEKQSIENWNEIKQYFLDHMNDFDYLVEYFRNSGWEFVQLQRKLTSNTEMYDIYNLEGHMANQDVIDEINSILQELDLVKYCVQIDYDSKTESCEFAFGRSMNGIRLGEPVWYLIEEQVVDQWYLYTIPDI